MDMSFGIQQHVIGLEIAMNDTLRVDILQSTAKLGHPEPYSFLCETLARDMKPKITAIHEIDHKVAEEEISDWARTWYKSIKTYIYSIS